MFTITNSFSFTNSLPISHWREKCSFGKKVFVNGRRYASSACERGRNSIRQRSYSVKIDDPLLPQIKYGEIAIFVEYDGQIYAIGRAYETFCLSLCQNLVVSPPMNPRLLEMYAYPEDDVEEFEVDWGNFFPIVIPSKEFFVVSVEYIVNALIVIPLAENQLIVTDVIPFEHD